jgi:FkbM family methyltransferase
LESADSEYLITLYQQLFNRDPDRDGFEFWQRKLSSGTSHGELLKIFWSSNEFKINLPKLMARSILELPFLNSFSQFQEDQLLVQYLTNANFSSPYVVDVGAHSIIGSNSFIFSHYFKWPTLLVEANSDLIPELQKNFPINTKVLNLAIGISEGSAEFYVSKNSYVSSIDQKQAQQWGDQLEKRSVPMRRLKDVLHENHVPLDFGLLTIDIEGLDLVVLEDLLLHSNYRPRFIIAEIKNSPNDVKSGNLITNQNIAQHYRVIAETHANAILSFVP